jgi:hypothetical protein
MIKPSKSADKLNTKTDLRNDGDKNMAPKKQQNTEKRCPGGPKCSKNSKKGAPAASK